MTINSRFINIYRVSGLFGDSAKKPHMLQIDENKKMYFRMHKNKNNYFRIDENKKNVL